MQTSRHAESEKSTLHLFDSKANRVGVTRAARVSPQESLSLRIFILHFPPADPFNQKILPSSATLFPTSFIASCKESIAIMADILTQLQTCLDQVSLSTSYAHAPIKSIARS